MLLFTFGACYMRDVNCPEGWIARTISTAIYVALVVATILATRWLLKLVDRRAAARRDGML